ncbi:hypothetical protein D8Y22_22215 [Salinadaptatus halalkaliphilus]|uniref:PD-(D/E)XK nuclease family protein n=1 Tax=Salinadaptatus halalkaliphilus TaxID=2419781 RepID=A0A4S3TH33_9EURY|nr:hypothetical protein [Salinadaptatus halalkaliphilus]THE62790.1 hypothetical protein D8Y22_22215 [Salinadaptatus halalkaliphilus]
MSSPPTPPLEGVCKLLPQPSDRLLEVVADEYAPLAATYGAQNVLVLKRHPSGLERVRSELADDERVAGVPRVESLPEHASKVIEAYDPTLERLEYEERIELISLVIAGASRDVPAYLESASDHERFGRDVGQLLLEATRQGKSLGDVQSTGRGDDDRSIPQACLAFLYAMNDRFHEAVSDRGYLERAQVVPRAVSLLADDADSLAERVTAGYDAVLAVEFEEYRALDRRYLGAVSADADLVCLGERHASVERTRVEPGRIEAVVGSGLEIELLEPPETGTVAGESDRSPHRAITRFLATGETPATGAATGETTAEDTGRTYRLRAQTARKQANAVATEIQALRDRQGWDHDAFAVAVPTVERVPDTRRRLRRAGVPTATIGTPSLASDPAVLELYTVISLQCLRRRGGPDEDPLARSDDYDEALNRLRARVPDFTPDLLEACDDVSVSRSLERWIHRTDLKGRIATTEEWIDAREQYAGIRRVLEIARFVEETDLVGPDWDGLRRMVERTIRYDAPYVHTVETQPPTGGVAVCAIDDLSYDSRRAVFILDLIDDVYPGEQFCTQLFPTAWLRDLPSFPAVTDPSPETVADTFTPVEAADAVGDPFATYHAQRARRRLARAGRVATDRLYFCSYERERDGLRRRYDESRYVTYAKATPGIELESVDARPDAEIYGGANALEALLEQPRAELERVLREASTGGQADLADTEALFEELAVVLDDDAIDDDLVEAVHSQFEFAAGEVLRDE